MGSLLYAAFFLSGVSGLIYQITWVRQFGNVLGNTVHSAALVVAVFMLGLGVGSYVAGVWADRRRHPGEAGCCAPTSRPRSCSRCSASACRSSCRGWRRSSRAGPRYTIGADGWQELSTASHAVRAAAVLGC